jgi:type IV fimbrial biogenesis protein FimT
MNKKNTKKKFYNKQAGFSLIELMVAIAIFAIMSGIAIPNFISWLPDYRLRSAARDVVSCLQEAKMMAVKDNVRVVVIFNQFTEIYTEFIDNVPIGGNWALDGTERIVRQVTVPAGIDIVGAATIGFDGRGLSAGAAASVQLQNVKLNSNTVNVNLAGGIRVQ